MPRIDKPYKAKSITGAQDYVRRLLKLRRETEALLDSYARDRIMLAKLAAEGPIFFNPIYVAEAKNIRDEILKSLGMNPDGTFIGHGKAVVCFYFTVIIACLIALIPPWARSLPTRRLNGESVAARLQSVLSKFEGRP